MNKHNTTITGSFEDNSGHEIISKYPKEDWKPLVNSLINTADNYIASLSNEELKEQ